MFDLPTNTGDFEPTFIQKLDKYSTKYYDLYTAKLTEKGQLVYMIVNKETNVVEFQHDNMTFVREWLNHFSNKLAELDSGKTTVEETPPQMALFN